MIQYGPSAKKRSVTIGTVIELTLRDARARATKHKLDIREGGDPRKRILEAKAALAQAVTVEQLVQDFIDVKIRSGNWGKAHAGEATRRLGKHIVPAFGHREPAEISKRDVNRLQIRMGETAGPVEANRVRSLLHHFLEWAREEAHFPEDRRNPAAVSRTSAVKPYRETSRDRWLLKEEAPGLFMAADRVAAEIGDPYLAGLVRLLLLTGLRKSELIARTWADVDLKARTLSVPPEHKSRRPHTVFLSAYALEVLRSLPRSPLSDAPLFPNPRTGRARKDFKKAWRRVRTEAGLTGDANLTVHGLRRTSGSWLVQADVPKDVIRRILQHTRGDVTDIYMRLDDPTLRDAMETLGNLVRSLDPAASRESSAKFA